MNPKALDALTREPEIGEAFLKAEIARELKSSIYSLARFLGYLEVNKRTHNDMIRTLESPLHRKLIVMPRGTFKSTLGCIVYPIWRLIRNPNDRILLDSEVYTNSKNFLRVIKYHLADPKLIDLFGEFQSADNWTEGEITINQRATAYKEASITCGGIGTVKVGQHYNCVIGDDYNSGNNSSTPEARQKVVSHYRMNLAILEPEGDYVIIGTRYAVDDIIGWIAENELDPDQAKLVAGGKQ